MWIEYNPNPTSSRRKGDCAIRAVAKALDIDWENAYTILCYLGFQMGDLPNSNSVISAALRENGFIRVPISNNCPDCYTVRNFSKEHKQGKYVAGTGEHVVAIIDGNYYDSWDSGDEIVAYVWGKELPIS